jgi:hypothetical protein
MVVDGEERRCAEVEEEVELLGGGRMRAACTTPAHWSEVWWGCLVACDDPWSRGASVVPC